MLVEAIACTLISAWKKNHFFQSKFFAPKWKIGDFLSISVDIFASRRERNRSYLVWAYRERFVAGRREEARIRGTIIIHVKDCEERWRFIGRNANIEGTETKRRKLLRITDCFGVGRGGKGRKGSFFPLQKIRCGWWTTIGRATKKGNRPLVSPSCTSVLLSGICSESRLLAEAFLMSLSSSSSCRSSPLCQTGGLWTLLIHCCD